MRTMERIALLLAAALVAAGTAHAQTNPRGKAETAIGGKKVSIEYGRPSLRGRDMLAKASPGTVWRMGADQATTIQTEGDLVFGNVTIPKGSYSLFARRKDEKSWELIFNKQTGQWGTEHDPKQDLAAVPLTGETAAASTEMLTIELAPAGEFKLSWGTQVLKAPLKVK